MIAYKITATAKDDNGVRIDACTAETLGDAHGRLYGTEAAAMNEAEYLQDDLSEVNETTEYFVEEVEVDEFDAAILEDAENGNLQEVASALIAEGELRDADELLR